MIDKTKHPERDMHDHVVMRSPFKPSEKAAIFLVEPGPKIDPEQIVQPTEQLAKSAALFAARSERAEVTTPGNPIAVAIERLKYLRQLANAQSERTLYSDVFTPERVAELVNEALAHLEKAE